MTGSPADTIHDADVLVIGWGLAGLVAASEAVRAGRRVVLLDQESRSDLGGQAHWSFGGIETDLQSRARERRRLAGAGAVRRG